MTKGRTCLVFILLWLQFSGVAQEETNNSDSGTPANRKTSLNGYFSDLFSPQYNNLQDQWKATNYLNQRLNFNWTPSGHFSFTAQLRSRLLYNQAGPDTSYSNIYDGLVWQKEKLYFNSNFDRFNLKFTQDKFEVTAGRQRINWGQSFVWNPNDLFNSYSFFDFDYIERPGSDAIRIQYYNSFTSSSELAVKIDRYKKVTAAGLYRFNLSGWDYQLLGGMLSSEDAVAGAGFTGNIKSTGIYGEASYFRPVKNFADTTALAMVDLGCSKTFSNNIGLQFEGLYVSKEMNINSLYNFFKVTLDVRKIAFAKVNLFGNITYPISPLITGSLAVMWFPDTGGINGFYTGPSFDISLGNNLGFSVIAQYFNGNFPDTVTQKLEKQILLLSFVRLKWNF
jgi:hypothetical protein